MTTMTVDATTQMTSVADALSAPLFRYLLHRVRGARQLAEDLLQETMLRAWRAIATMPETDEQRRRWLYTIARNVTIDADRARRARPETVGGLDFDLIDAGRAVPDQVAAVLAVRAALAKLPAHHRDAVVQIYFGGRTLAEAAAELGVPVGTVKSRVHYALRALRTDLA
jgi:RNA polymerase sigma-70 factor, ECF subfamily